MAVTRINNNQITDASTGNAYVGIDASTKLQAYSVTAGKIANNLVYGSDLTVSGNLTVNGTSTAIDTTITTIEDPVIVLASTQTGSPAVDIGFLGERGDDTNIAFVWDESAGEFVTAFTSTSETSTTITITSYADFHTQNANVAGNLIIGGNIDITGNVTSLSVTGNITGGNLLTPGIVSATGNITGGNVITTGVSATTVSATGNITGGNLSAGSGLIETTGNVNGGNVNTTNISLTGNIVSDLNVTTNITASNLTTTANVTGGNVLFGSGIVSGTGNIYANKIFADIAGNIDAAGSNTQVQFNDTGDILGASAGFTFDKTANLLTVSGNINGGNLTTGGQVVSTGNISGGNVNTGGQVVATGNINGGNLTTGGQVVSTGNITGGNVNTTNISLSGNVISDLNVTTNITGSNITATANVTGGNLSAGSGLIETTGNVNGGNVNTNNIYGTTTISLNPGTGNVNVNNKNINNLADPEQDQDAATKFYVDSVAQGLDIKASVVYATANTLTNLNGSYTYNNGTSGVGATITFSGTGAFSPDGTAVSVGERILVKNEAGAFVNNTTPSAAFNGIYVVTDAGGGTNAVLTRATDFDNGSPSGEIPSAFTFVEYGSTWADSGWVCTTNSPVTVGTTQITWTQFSGAGTYTAGAGLSLTGTQFSVLTDGNANPTTAINGSNEVVVPAGAAFTTPNIGAATGTSLSVTGSVIGTTISASGNVIGGNVTTAGLISATGNVDSGNVNTTNISLSGNVISNLNVTGNVNGGNLNAVTGVTAVTGYFTGNVDVLGNLNASIGVVYANSGIFYGNAVTGNNAAFAGVPGFTQLGSNVVMQFAGNVNSYSQLNFQNVNSGNVASTDFIATADNGSDTTYYIDVGINSSTFDDPIDYPGFGPNDSYVHNHGGNLILNPETSGKAINFMVGGTDTTDVIGYINVNGLYVTGVISATGNINGANVNTGNLSLTGNVLSALNVNGNITGAQEIVAVGNIYGGNLATTGDLQVTGDIDGGNIYTTGTLQGGNIVITGDEIYGTNGIVNINEQAGDVDFAVNGDVVANIFYVDAGAATASFGTSAQTTNAIVAFNAPTSVLMPVGNVAQRPGTGVTGMLRFNTTSNALEVYDNSAWSTVGVPSFTVIADEQFYGDGSTVAYTLSSTQTTSSCIVSINGVVQIPTSAYSVSGTDPTCVLTFTEAPEAGDVIDVREITTTTTVTSLSNLSGNAEISANDASAEINITGNFMPTGNGTQALGSNTHRFSNIWLTGNTLTLGSIVMKDTGGQVGFFEADGTTPATIDAASVDTTQIASGTSSVAVVTSGGNIRANVGGSTITTTHSGGLNVTGVVSASGNVTGGNVSAGTGTISVGGLTLNGNTITSTGSTLTIDPNSTGGTDGEVIITGNLQVQGNVTYINSNVVSINDLVFNVANNAATASAANGAGLGVGPAGAEYITLTYNSSSNVWVATNGLSVTGIMSATGNVTGGNVITAGLVSLSSIVKTGSNAVGNIGSSSNYFNTVFAQATSALYADLAENYVADAEYAPGTVVVFGGTAEVTVNAVDGDRRVAGVVSTNPSYIMNGGLEADHVATVALTGRVPTMVIGPVKKGDLMVAAGLGRARAEADPKVGTVIGKALEDFNGAEGTIEVVVGRF